MPCQEEGVFSPQPQTSYIAELAELPTAQTIHNVCIPSKISPGKALDIVSPVPPAAVLDFRRKAKKIAEFLNSVEGIDKERKEEMELKELKRCKKHAETSIASKKGKLTAKMVPIGKHKKMNWSCRYLLMKIFLFMTAARTWKITITQPVLGVGKSIPRQPGLMTGFSASIVSSGCMRDARNTKISAKSV
ncbi:hypothetical protein QE152_g21911 [Popillia japonica]|uniref:Uncharacterized protein n=1 Tax=Popillia japonica TaxID=7064 RepID=A0AAW1KMT3_POPJA